MTTDGLPQTPSSEPKAEDKSPTDPPLVSEAPSPDEVEAAKDSSK
jgi:hypothetical protein